MASPYDSYRLANSTEIPRFQGSAGDEYIKVGQYRQGLYDQAYQGGMGVAQSANELNSMLPQDQWAVDELRTSTQGKIKQLAANKDWENALPEVTQLARNYAYREKEIMAPQQAAAEYKKSLGDKEHNLTPEQQSALYQMSIKGYSGLKKNDRGQYIGAFNGVTPAKNIDVNKKVDEWLKDAVVHKWGNEAEMLSSGDGGMWIVKNGQKVEHLGADQLSGIVNAAKSNDQEYQAYQNMQGKIAGFNAANSGISSIEQLPKGKLRDGVQKLVDKGLSLPVAYASIVKDATMSDIDANALRYGVGKYAVDNRFTNSGFNANPYELKKAPNEATVISPLISQGPDSKLTADEKNYDKLTKNIAESKRGNADLQASVDKLEKDLKSTSLSPATRTQKQTELIGLRNQLDEAKAQNNRSQQIIDYSKDQTARGLGYDDYNDFVTKHKKPYTEAVRKIFPNGFTTDKGRRISVDEIAEAAIDNRLNDDLYKPNAGGDPLNPNSSIERSKGAILTLKDGSVIKIPANQKGIALNDQIGVVSNRDQIRSFSDKLKNTHEKNIENFAIQTNNISMNEPLRKEVEAHIKSNMDGTKFSDPGQNNSVKAPKNFQVYTVGTLGLGNSTKVRVQELDDDNKPTGKFYDVNLNSNLADIVSNQAAESQDGTARMAADMLTPGSGARQLSSMIPGQSMQVGQLRQDASNNSDPTDVKLTINRDRQGKPVYSLVDEQGNIISTADGKPYTTDNVGTAGSWIDNIQGKSTFSNGKRQSEYNARSRRTR